MTILWYYGYTMVTFLLVSLMKTMKIVYSKTDLFCKKTELRACREG
jgi:hypothetical protein